ncbi:hypothetical protein L1887_27825 [Cichorium endivia]|nr:hypothetical protein L1887_27825 [Cichorium endivia]
MLGTLSGADFDAEVAEIRVLMVNEVNELGETALYTIAENGHLEVVKELLKYSENNNSAKKRTTSVMDSEPYSSDEGEGSANSSMEMIEVSEDGGDEEYELEHESYNSTISTLHGVLEKYWPTLSKLQIDTLLSPLQDRHTLSEDDRGVLGRGILYTKALFKDLIGQSSSYHQLKEKNGWLVAGGIKPENVTEALSILKPDGVDVGSVISLGAAVGFMVYGGRLFVMLRRFPIESRGRQKKLHEIVEILPSALVLSSYESCLHEEYHISTI